MAISHDQMLRGKLRIHESLDELSTDLAEYVSDLSEESIMERGVFSIALSGGSLIGFLGKLCQAPFNKTVDWSKWYVFWADERVVPRNHADSNYKLAKDEFLSKVPIVPSHVYSINDTVSAEQAASDYEFSIRQLVKSRTITASEFCDCPKFDLILLGMGSDGHIASLFPRHPVLEVRDEWVTFVTDSPKPLPQRITLTLPVINAAANVAVVVAGSGKAESVRMAVGGVESDCSALPARMVQPTNGKLVWFLDMPAASKIEHVGATERDDY